MSILPPSPDHNIPRSPEILRQAEIAVRIASTRREAGNRVLGYYVRCAMSHGLTIDEICRAGNLHPSEVMLLSDPAVC